MQRTPNLNLPQFEPTDKYSLDDYNQAYMTLDTKIKEAQDLINTWTQFKNSGGNIGGRLSLRADQRLYDEVNKNDFFRLVSSNGDFYLQQNSDNPGGVTRQGDFYFGGHSKNANGYTKLPNGMIMQWGAGIYAHGSQVLFPISFNNRLSITCNLHDTMGDFVVVGSFTNNGFVYHSNQGKNGFATWLAIGY